MTARLPARAGFAYNGLMRRWNLTADDPLVLCLAADARLVAPDYLDDQIWELTLRGGEPSAIAAQTTYGLRARGMRLFPTLVIDGRPFSDPAHFTQPPAVVALLPNYLRVEAVPAPGMMWTLEYWVPESHVLAGRISVANRDTRPHEVRLRLSAILRPGEDPQAMHAEMLHGLAVLTGRTGGLAPVIFLSGGATAEPSPYPSIGASTTLASGGMRSWVWAHAAQEDVERSLESARGIVSRAWDAEVARLERLADSLVEVETGDREWDAAFHQAQVACLGSFVGPTRAMPHAWPVAPRSPDRGYSSLGDGRDHAASWDGIEVQTAVHLARQILPAAPDLVRGMIRDVLSARLVEGGVDGRPGLARQRGGFLCAPLLADLALEAGGPEFLREVLPGLRNLFDTWFTSHHDRDGDGVPEWDHTLQAGLDDSPTFSRWARWSEGLDLTSVESPDLAAYLFREGRALLEIRRATGSRRHLTEVETRLDTLRTALDAAWVDGAAMYGPLDRDTHEAHGGRCLATGDGSFRARLRGTLQPGGRLVIRVEGPEAEAHAIRITVHGRPVAGRARSERLTHQDLRWYWDIGTVTTARAYRSVDSFEIAGLSDAFHTEIRLADMTRQEIGQLFPLWAGMVDPARARRLIRRAVLDTRRFWRAFGIPSCSALDPAYRAGESGPGAVRLPANSLVGEALVDQGYTDQAAELVTRLMAAILATMRDEKTTREAHHPDTGAGLGERSHPAGVAPLSLFLRVLGVRLIDAQRVWIKGRNPFPWPVTLRWRGMTVQRLPTHTLITFPNGQEVRVDDSQAQLVEQDD